MLAKSIIAAVEFCRISILKPIAVKQSCHIVLQMHVQMYMFSTQPQQFC